MTPNGMLFDLVYRIVGEQFYKSNFNYIGNIPNEI